MQNAMRKIELPEIQSRLKEVLKVITDYCDQHNLKYAISFGTLLGAVRHNDIIPWDDDIDIVMPRPDFDRLVALLRKDKIDGYTIFAPGDENYIYTFAKFCDDKTKLIEKAVQDRFSVFGMYIDIFPFDGIAYDVKSKDFDRCIKKIDYYHWAVFYSVVKETSFKSILHELYFNLKKLYYTKGKSTEWLLEKRNSVIKNNSVDFDKAEMVTSYNSLGYIRRVVLKKTDFDNRIKLKLGDNEFWGFGNYDEYLTQVYGDYMQFPPEDQRNSGHVIEVYVKE